DAGHMFTDVASLLLSWLAMRLGRKAPDDSRTYGYQRLKILAAYTNAVLLFFLSAVIVTEAFDRIFSTHKAIDSMLMLVVAGIGFATNVASYFVLNQHGHDHDAPTPHNHAEHSDGNAPHHDDGHTHGHTHGHGHGHDLNVQSALAHVLSDLLGSAAAIVAAILIMLFGWTIADPILSIFVSLLILGYAWKLAKQTAHILIEGAPDSTMPDKIKETIIANIKGVKDVHHVHVWSLTEKQPIATLDVTIDDMTDYHNALCAIRKILLEKHNLDHVTIQIEKAPCFDL
ncbi:MAG: cation diffusion facilitator family transporter, partial [Alphaproteobacteria bacterium]|nr:cation diffusion facilitator family transporter [Alphaproteobacteria bacterium]